MTIVNWMPALEIGIESLDADHRALIEQLNRVHLASEQSDITEALEGLLDLRDQTRVHFAREEALLAGLDDQVRELHRNEHSQLLDEINCHIDDLVAGRIVAASIALHVQAWLLRHIAVSDRQLGGLRVQAQVPARLIRPVI